MQVVTALEAKQPQRALCSPCVQLGGQALNTLLNALLNVGVVQGCGTLCGHLATKAVKACDILCGVVGIKAFISALDHADLDTIYFCEEIHACPTAPDNASASLGPVQAQPPAVAKGDTIQLTVEVDVKVASGVGEFRLSVDGPVTQPASSSFLLADGIPAGSQSLAVKLALKDDDSGDFPVIWSPGTYHYTFEVCQGECESKHPHSKVFGKKMGNFTLTETGSVLMV